MNEARYSYATGWISGDEAIEFEQFFSNKGYKLGARQYPIYERNAGTVRTRVLNLTIKESKEFQKFIARFNRKEKGMEFKEADMIKI